jgi:dihydroorotate dehydrogenase
VIGVGGITHPDQAEALLAMGCAGIQVYSGLIFEGPGLPLRILRQLARHKGQARLTGPAA